MPAYRMKERTDGKMKVCHVTSAHNRYDIRIFEKECISLAKNDYDVTLIVNDDEKGEIKNGVKIASTGFKPSGRRQRMISSMKYVWAKMLEADANIYHFHDPGLLPYGLKLKRQGKKVIFDSHEDVPAQILDKEWIPFYLRRIISRLYKTYESYVVKRIDAVVAATPHIAEQFEGRAHKITVINNYPKLDDIIFHDTPFEERKPIVCYAGGISEQRGESIMVEAVKDLDAILIIAGEHDLPGEHEKSEIEGVIYPGKLNREEINKLYSRAVVGLVVLQPTANYFYSLPIKMFEYMAAGLPFVASNFPLWKRIVEENGCGICVDSGKADEVRAAVKELLDNPSRAQSMGRKGREAVEKKYNWDIEKEKLMKLYQMLC